MTNSGPLSPWEMYKWLVLEDTKKKSQDFSSQTDNSTTKDDLSIFPLFSIIWILIILVIILMCYI